jgi:hypothetical protein
MIGSTSLVVEQNVSAFGAKAAVRCLSDGQTSVRLTLHGRQADFLPLVPYCILDYYSNIQSDETYGGRRECL